MWWHKLRNKISSFGETDRAHLNRRGRQSSRLLAAEVRTSTVVILDTLCSEVVWRVLATHSIRHFTLHFPSRASPCTITFQLDSAFFPRLLPSNISFCFPYFQHDKHNSTEPKTLPSLLTLITLAQSAFCLSHNPSLPETYKCVNV